MRVRVRVRVRVRAPVQMQVQARVLVLVLVLVLVRAPVQVQPAILDPRLMVRVWLAMPVSAPRLWARAPGRGQVVRAVPLEAVLCPARGWSARPQSGAAPQCCCSGLARRT